MHRCTIIFELSQAFLNNTLFIVENPDQTAQWDINVAKEQSVYIVTKYYTHLLYLANIWGAEYMYRIGIPEFQFTAWASLVHNQHSVSLLDKWVEVELKFLKILYPLRDY